MARKSGKDHENELAPGPMDAHAGGRIRQRRLQMGWASERLAQTIGVARSTLQALENGTRRVQAQRLADIGTALKIAPSWFLEDFPVDGVPTNGDPLRETLTKSRRAMSMVEAYVRLPREQQKALLVVTVDLAEHAGPAPDGDQDDEED